MLSCHVDKFAKLDDLQLPSNGITVGGNEKDIFEGEPVVLKFSVSDEGIGISKQDIPKLFHQFSQVDTSLTRTYGMYCFFPYPLALNAHFFH